MSPAGRNPARLQLLPRMTEEEVENRLAAMDRAYARLTARPNGARLLLFELGLIRNPDARARKSHTSKKRRKVGRP